MRAHSIIILLALASVSAMETQEKAMLSANPIRKIVTLLQNMQKKVEDEGKKEEELFDKFMCFCKAGRASLEASVEKAKTSTIPDLEASVEETVGKKKQMDADLVSHKADQEAAKESIAAATKKREEEAATFKTESEEQKADLAGLGKALESIKKATAAAFLQTADGDRFKEMIQNSKYILETDRDDVMAFLQGQDSEADSGQIIGIMETMMEEMTAALKELEETEAKAIADFDALVMEKTKEGEALQVMREDKMVRTGELAVEVVELKNELEDTQESMAEDEKMLNGLEDKCAAKKKEWAEACKVRADEILAIADAIKMLNSDDALELFKKTVGLVQSSFVQIQVTAQAMRSRALEMIREGQRAAGPRGRQQLDFLAMALHGKKVGFDKVLKLIDEMVATLKKEQEDDDAKKENCLKEFDESDDKKKELERIIGDTDTAIEETKDGIERLAVEIEALDDTIKALDKSVAEATEQRKEENEEYTAFMAGNTAAKELLGMVKNRLNKFYNPKLYKPAASAASFVQVQAHTHHFLQYGKAEESSGIIGMIDEMAAGLEQEMTVAEAEEKDAQSDYEKLMEDSAAKRATDSKSMEDKVAAKADAEAALEGSEETMASTKKELEATKGYIMSLHADCDFLLMYYDQRKEARASEIDAMGKAKAVLNGADYSLVQMGRSSKVVKFLRGA